MSGLAYGIDAVAHRTALEEGGRTVAVLGSGLARIYPAAHTRLAHRAARQGVVFSEFALDADPDAPHFPERNRIVSGLTLGTLVVESRGEGGALITARMACEQNREVFAVPGDAGRPTSEGTNRLIQRSHAKLVLTVEDILEEFGAGGGRSLPAGDAGGASGSSPDASPADLPPLAGPAGSTIISPRMTLCTSTRSASARTWRRPPRWPSCSTWNSRAACDNWPANASAAPETLPCPGADLFCVVSFQ